MSIIKFHCPHCQQRLSVSAQLLGRKIACPRCGGHIRLPEPATVKKPTPPPPPPPAAIPVKAPNLATTIPISFANGDITFQCSSCGCKLVVTDRAAGREIPCWRCQNPVTVPSSTLPPDPVGRQTVNINLGEEHKQTMVKLIERSREGDTLASQTLLTLGTNALPHLVEALENALEDAKVHIGDDQLVKIIVQMGIPGVKPLITKLGKRRRAYFALGKIGSGEAVDALVRELSSVNWRRVEAACIGLSFVTNPAVLQNVLSHLQQTCAQTRVGEVFSAASATIDTLQKRLAQL